MMQGSVLVLSSPSGGAAYLSKVVTMAPLRLAGEHVFFYSLSWFACHTKALFNC